MIIDPHLAHRAIQNLQNQVQNSADLILDLERRRLLDSLMIRSLKMSLDIKDTTILELVKECDLLKAKLGLANHKKNSSNSSMPPSSDLIKPPRLSLRKKSDRKAGGQKGHRGYHHSVITADAVKDLLPTNCSCCGKDLPTSACELSETRQVMDLPEIKPFTIDYRIYKAQCTCGVITKSDFPINVDSAFSFGPNIESLSSFLYNVQLIPYNRISDIFKSVFNTSISTGVLWNINQRQSDKASPTYQALKTGIEQSSSPIYFDDTTVFTNGVMGRVWISRTEKESFLFYSPTRAYKEVEQEFPNGFKNAIIVHDRYALNFQIPVVNHQMCTVHLLRDLKGLDELYNHPWSRNLSKLIKYAMECKNNLSHQACLQAVGSIELKFHKLLLIDLPEKHEKLFVFQKQMVKHQNYLFTFLRHESVRPDNNLAEQGLRGIKVKMKIGQFRSVNGTVTFLKLRSISETTAFNKQSKYEALKICSLCKKRISTRKLITENQIKYDLKSPSP